VSKTLLHIQEHGVIAVVEAPVRGQLLHWAKAVAEAGVTMVGIPVSLPDVTEVVDDLSDEAGVIIGVTNVTGVDQISVALAAGATFVISPICDPEIIRAGSERGIDVIAGAATATEIARAREAGAEMIAVHPVGAMGGVDHFRLLAQQFRGVPLLASGAVNPDNAPAFLEVGALGAIVDEGVFPQPSEPAAGEVIRARAAALMEVCADAMGTPKRISFTEAIKHRESASSAPAPPGDTDDAPLDALIASERAHDPFADGAAPLDLGMEDATSPVLDPAPPPPPPPPPATAPPTPPKPPPAPNEDGDFEAFDNLED
jgi:2-dehydro-3-deoxyphosphogluconate aldolase/(4S)-4-hydroxy-2-oxoglutarate aldolase